MLIRVAVEADAHKIAEVHVHSWQSAYAGLLPDELLNGLSVEERETNWKTAIADSSTLVYVCEDGQEVVGFVAHGRGREEEAKERRVGEIYAIYLVATSWGQGFGEQLMKLALDDLHRLGYSIATLWVLDSNTRAIRFYERAGFRADGQEKSEELAAGIPVREVRYAYEFEGRS